MAVAVEGSHPGLGSASLTLHSGPVRYVETLPTPPRCLVMGVVNVTPDSFSDGGLWLEPEPAVHYGLSLLRDGADLVDVGGESTRPGAQRPSQGEELDRVLPVVSALAAAGATVSIDTMRSAVARQAVAAGAQLVNDVSGGLADEAMLPTVADLGVAYLAMHWRGHADAMQRRASYDDVLGEVTTELEARVAAAIAAGIEPGRLAIDPGIGFAKVAEHNWAILRHLGRLHALGYPLVVGSSRKSFLGRLLAAADGTPRPALERDAASAALTTLAALAGVWCVRVHDVGRSVDAVAVARRFAAEGL